MPFIKVSQPIYPDTTLEEIREFVRLTQHADSDTKISEYEENGDLIGLEVFMTVDEFNSKE